MPTFDTLDIGAKRAGGLTPALDILLGKRAESSDGAVEILREQELEVIADRARAFTLRDVPARAETTGSLASVLAGGG